MHQPLEDLEPLTRTYERLAEALMMSDTLYLKKEYDKARDIMVDVSRLAELIHRRVGMLARAKARG